MLKCSYQASGSANLVVQKKGRAEGGRRVIAWISIKKTLETRAGLYYTTVDTSSNDVPLVLHVDASFSTLVPVAVLNSSRRLDKASERGGLLFHADNQ